MPIVVPVLAMQTYEYTSYNGNQQAVLRTIYLSKLDSTGLVQPRSSQHLLLHGLIEGYLQYQHLESSRLGVPLRFHLVSRAQPEYAFPLSHRLPCKRVQTGKALMRWWQLLLNGVTLSSEIKWQRFWWVPGSSKLLGEQDHLWSWGMPFDKTASAMDSLPMFPDDPVSVCVQRSVQDRSVSVKTVLDGMLERTQDFSRGESCLFLLQVNPSKLKGELKQGGEEPKVDNEDEGEGQELDHSIKGLTEEVNLKELTEEKILEKEIEVMDKTLVEIEELLQLREGCQVEPLMFGSEADALVSTLRLQAILSNVSAPLNLKLNHKTLPKKEKMEKRAETPINFLAVKRARNK